MHQKSFFGRDPPGTTEELTALPRPLAVLQGQERTGRGMREEKGGEGREGSLYKVKSNLLTTVIGLHVRAF